MSGICPVVTLSPHDYDAVLFDLDGMESLNLIVIITVLKYIVTLFIMGLVMSLLP